MSLALLDGDHSPLEPLHHIANNRGLIARRKIDRVNDV